MSFCWTAASHSVVNPVQNSFRRICLLHNDYKDVSNILVIEMNSPGRFSFGTGAPRERSLCNRAARFRSLPRCCSLAVGRRAHVVWASVHAMIVLNNCLSASCWLQGCLGKVIRSPHPSHWLLIQLMLTAREAACAANTLASAGVFWLMPLAMARRPAPLVWLTRPRPGVLGARQKVIRNVLRWKSTLNP